VTYGKSNRNKISPVLCLANEVNKIKIQSRNNAENSHQLLEVRNGLWIRLENFPSIDQQTSNNSGTKEHNSPIAAIRKKQNAKKQKQEKTNKLTN
jgi:hypothetical protein